jgi:hypothetical protein
MQASLPTSLGGLGVRSTARAAPAAFLGSWALVESLVGQRFLWSGLPFLVSVVSNKVDVGVLPFQVALRSARDGLPQSARPILAPFLEMGRVSESRVHERLSGAIDIVASEAIRDRLPAGDYAGRARLVSKMGPGAAAWLTAISLFQALQIEDKCFRMALRTWLGLPYTMVAGIRLCECGEELQAGILGGQHLFRCGLGSDRNDTHHSIRDTMSDTSCGRRVIVCAESRVG